MIPLNGIVGRQPAWTFDNLKRAALFVDSFYVGHFGGKIHPDQRAEVASSFAYLEDKKIIRSLSDLLPGADDIVNVHSPEVEEQLDYALRTVNYEAKRPQLLSILDDAYVRIVAAKLDSLGHRDFVPILNNPKRWHLPPDKHVTKTETVQIAIDHLPTPDESSSWQDIIDFRTELRDKLWGFRRFMASLATNTRSEDEVRDEVEWRLHEYEEAMRLNKLKSGTSLVETFVIPAAEGIENLLKFNWSKIAKGVISVKKRQLDLLEAEMKAPGRECAYVFRAHETFGRANH